MFFLIAFKIVLLSQFCSDQDDSPLDITNKRDGTVDYDHAEEMSSPLATDVSLSHSITGQFKVLTYNVAGLPPGISQSSTLKNMSQISTHLNQYDIALVQEDFFFHSLLSNHTHPPYQTKPADISFGYLAN